jgi:aminoglycoside phosphotransferase family enzyme/predicted kinase/CBS domain-containing protein
MTPGSADPALLEALARSEAYPHDPSAAGGVRVVQTHLSLVFLTGERVYKVRKSVDLGFVDFSTRQKRDADCLREVVLNRRLAPDVYLGVAPVRRLPGGFEVGPIRETLRADAEAGSEHCVVMRRLPDGRDLLSLLRAGRARPEHLDAVADRLVRFHAEHRLGRPAPWSETAWLEHIESPVRACVTALRDPSGGVGAGRIERLEWLERDRFEACRSLFEVRRREGRAVDGHGDVHLEHVWFEEDTSPALLVDCIEFDEALRRIDVASEVAFLAMDLAYRDRSDLEARFVRRYARAADDFGLYGVLDYFAGYRALVRAKVAGLAARDSTILPEQRSAASTSTERHLALAEGLFAAPGRGRLVVMCGSVGSGKSSAAEILADMLEGVVISSDWTRKHLAGLDPTRSKALTRDALYEDRHKERVYRALLERARPVVDSGRTAILDATFGRQAERNRALAWAREVGVQASLVEVECAPAVARERLLRREAQGRDPSDAGPDLLDRSRQAYEPPDEWPQGRRWRLLTDESDWPAQAARIAARLAAARMPFGIDPATLEASPGRSAMPSTDHAVSEIMRRDFVTLELRDRLDLVDDIMKLGRIRHMPVLDDGRLVGVVSQRDLFAASLSKALEFEAKQRRAFLRSVEVEEAMTADPATVSPDTPLFDAARLMIQRRIGCLPVVNEAGSVVGLVTETDLLRAAYRDD